MSPLAGLLRGFVLGYRYLFSPVLPAACRYAPSCSAYALEALGRHGALLGSWLAVRRLCRCHPWGGAGFDPVPMAVKGQAYRATSRSFSTRRDKKKMRASMSGSANAGK